LNSTTDDITQWRIKLRVPGRPDAPEGLATYLHNEFCKPLKGHSKRQKEWNKPQPSPVVCILVRIVGKLKHSVFPDGVARTACDTCSCHIQSSKGKPWPCAVVEKDADGFFLLVLPLREELRRGKTWEDKGYWMRNE
jgi:hypothetical protein